MATSSRGGGDDGPPVEPMTGRDIVPPCERIGHLERDESDPVLEYSHVEDGVEFFVIGDTTGSAMVPREAVVDVKA